MFKLATHKYWFGLVSLLAMALAGGAGFKWNSNYIVEWLTGLT